MAGAAYDDQTPVREGPAPAAEVLGRVERISAPRQQERWRPHDSVAVGGGKDASRGDNEAGAAEEPGARERRVGEVAAVSGTNRRGRVEARPRLRAQDHPVGD